MAEAGAEALAGKGDAFLKNAQRVVRENAGGIERTVNMIVAELAKEDTYVAPE